jgi:shikimate kinase
MDNNNCLIVNYILNAGNQKVRTGGRPVHNSKNLSASGGEVFYLEAAQACLQARTNEKPHWPLADKGFLVVAPS